MIATAYRSQARGSSGLIVMESFEDSITFAGDSYRPACMAGGVLCQVCHFSIRDSQGLFRQCSEPLRLTHEARSHQEPAAQKSN